MHLWFSRVNTVIDVSLPESESVFRSGAVS
jgi:hypothetical protein